MGDFVRKLLHAGLRDKIWNFMTSPAYLFALAVLTGLCYAASLEVALYTVFALIVVFTAVCGADMAPILPLLVFGYVSVSPSNNPGQNEASVFSGATGSYVVCLAVVIAAALLYRVIRDRKQMFRKNGTMTWGLVALTAAYMLSGIGFAGYEKLVVKNLIYAFLQGAAILLPYWLMVGGVDWKRQRRDYWAWMGLAVGCLLVFEVIWIYISRAVLANGVIDRTQIYTGWGMYNNVGGMLMFMIPFAFWLSTYHKKPWFGYLLGMVILAGVYLSCSRSAMLLGTAAYILCCLLQPAGRHSMLQWGILLGIAALAAVVVLLLRDQLFTALSQMLDGTNVHSRVDIYGQGLGQFVKNPIFGTSFYPKGGLAYSWSQTDLVAYMPARWHNTPVQLLAATGLVGFIAYGFHRYQTLRLALHRRSRTDALILIAIALILIGSLVDCHMFNVGPAMLYALLMGWLEKREV